MADGGEEDHDEEEEYIDAESGQVVGSCEGEGNAGGEMQEGEIVEEPKPLASALSSAATTPGYLQGGFFNWSALKMTKCQTLRKF